MVHYKMIVGQLLHISMCNEADWGGGAITQIGPHAVNCQLLLSRYSTFIHCIQQL